MQALTSRFLFQAVFYLASLTPLGLLLLASGYGGVWVWVGLAYMGALPVLVDLVSPQSAETLPEAGNAPLSDLLLVLIAIGAFVVLPMGVAAIGTLPLGQAIGLVLAMGLWLGQVVHPAAHELIHRGARPLYYLGVLAYAALLFGHHASSHRLVHHQHVATAKDPNTARKGEGFYRFALRAWRGSFVAGLGAENALRARAQSKARRIHPYAVYLVSSCGFLIAGWVVAGGMGVLVWILVALHAQSQILLSDYVQHYGLLRRKLDDDRVEPVGQRHSWNGGAWFSSGLMLNAPRHSDHHVTPSRRYPHLDLPDADQAPRLPWPLPLACMIALVPGLWRRRMKPHLVAWDAAKPG